MSSPPPELDIPQSSGYPAVRPRVLLARLESGSRGSSGGVVLAMSSMFDEAPLIKNRNADLLEDGGQSPDSDFLRRSPEVVVAERPHQVTTASKRRSRTTGSLTSLTPSLSRRRCWPPWEATRSRRRDPSPPMTTGDPSAALAHTSAGAATLPYLVTEVH